jgi:hypothetical protein
MEYLACIGVILIMYLIGALLYHVDTKRNPFKNTFEYLRKSDNYIPILLVLFIIMCVLYS